MNKVAGFQAPHEGESSPQRPVQRYKVTISGDSYFLVSDEAEEHVRTVARFVDEQMHALGATGLTDDPKRIAVLVALQCASKMFASNLLVENYQMHNDRLLSLIADEVSRLNTA